MNLFVFTCLLLHWWWDSLQSLMPRSNAPDVNRNVFIFAFATAGQLRPWLQHSGRNRQPACGRRPQHLHHQNHTWRSRGSGWTAEVKPRTLNCRNTQCMHSWCHISENKSPWVHLACSPLPLIFPETSHTFSFRVTDTENRLLLYHSTCLKKGNSLSKTSDLSLKSIELKNLDCQDHLA